MGHHAFICHPSQNVDIVENLAGRLREIGVETWVYSIDRTLADDSWQEIEERIQLAELFIFVASKYSRDAQGQHRELPLALERVARTGAASRMIPVVVDDVACDSERHREWKYPLPGQWLEVCNLDETFGVSVVPEEIQTPPSQSTL